MVQCNYSQYSSRYTAYRDGVILPAFDSNFSGGCLYDINIYCVHFTVGLFGKSQNVEYFPNIGPNRIDTSGILILDYGSFKAVCCGAKDSNSPAVCKIQGEDGYINFDSMPGQVQNGTITLNKQQPMEFDVQKDVIHMVNEFEKINYIVKNKNYDLCYSYMETTQIVMDVIEMARKKAGIVFPADLE